MKKTVTREVDCCDECGEEVHYEYSCMRCGAIYCSKHKQIVSYAHGIYVQGSGDGHYCKKCDAKLHRDRSDPLFNSYLAIAALRADVTETNKDFERRRKLAEDRCAAEFAKATTPLDQGATG